MRKGGGEADLTAGKFLNHKIKFGVSPVYYLDVPRFELLLCLNHCVTEIFRRLIKFLFCPDFKAC